VKVAKFVETKVLPALKQAQARYRPAKPAKPRRFVIFRRGRIARMICPKCRFESDNAAGCPKCGHRIAAESAGEKFGRRINWFAKAWFSIRTLFIVGAAILIYDRATAPFEVVTISVGLLIYARVASLELDYQFTSGALTAAQLQWYRRLKVTHKALRTITARPSLNCRRKPGIGGIGICRSG
jgi:hypothetical protein